MSNRANRPAALIAVATELPPPVLADLLGLTVQTAQRWAACREARTAGSAAKEGGIAHMRNIYLPPVGGVARPPFEVRDVMTAHDAVYAEVLGDQEAGCAL